MSLLLEARKKSLQAQSAQQDGNASQIAGTSEDASPLTASSEEAARSAGHNLFAAKSRFPVDGFAQLNRNLLFGLGIVILLVGGAAYLWRTAANNTMPMRGAPSAVVAAAPAVPEPAPIEPQPAERQEPPVAMESIPSAAQARETPPASPIRIERPHAEQVDPLLQNAYEAYRNGKLDEAQQMYQTLLRKDAQNADALLGLAAIAQQRGELRLAAQYYANVLALDPRNAAANAGMAALSEDDDNNETRLKLLLREQGNSAVLHFALGNLYAGQSRWAEAQQSYFNAVTLEPGNAEFAYNLAVSLDHLDQARPAAQYYQRALQLDPLNSAGFDHAQVSRRIGELSR